MCPPRFFTRYLWLVALFTLLAAAPVAVVNWRVDPLQFYRRASYPPFFNTQARFQNPGLARHYESSTLILGTSVSLGYDLAHAGERLGARPLNLAMQGASAREQALLLGIALRTGRVRRVVWDLNYEFFRGGPDWMSGFDGAFPAYFYDSNPLNDIPTYLLSLDTLKASTRVLLRRYPRMKIEELSRQHAARKPGFDSVRAAYDRARDGRFVFLTHPAEFAPELMRASFEANVLALVRAHPQVRFDLHFPPFSYAYHALIRDTAPASFEDEFRWKAHIEQECRALPNVRLFDFQGLPEIVLDLDRYTDTVHFDARTHDYLIDSIAADRHRATPETLALSESLLRREATHDWATRRSEGVPR